MNDELEQLRLELEQEKKANRRLERELRSALDDVEYLKRKLLLFVVLNVKKGKEKE